MSDQLLIIIASAFAGAYIAHIFQKRYWLYQKRIESYARLIEVIHEQRKTALGYAFSTKVDKAERHERLAQDFVPIRAQFYLCSFLLGRSGRSEVQEIISGFESRLAQYEDHPSPKSNEHLGFAHEIERLYDVLALEIASSRFVKAIWYAQLRRQRAQHELWMKNEFPKFLENISKSLDQTIANARKK